MKNKSKLILSIALFVGLIGSGYYFLFSKPDKAGNTVADNTFGWKYPVANFPSAGSGSQLAYSSFRVNENIPQGLPVRLKIPIIGVDSAIEDAFITSDGRMDVPKGSVNVAWFALGPHPGDIGSAVIGGHFGIRNGVPFVFYNLDKLKVGDKVYIVNDKGETLAFQVQSVKLFDRNADTTTVFTSKDDLAHLNLITCEGIWNKINGNYPERRVVFTDAITGEGAVVAKTSIVPIFRYTLHIGSYGPDVVALQTFLSRKGFLVISSGVADGIFGAKTRAAIIKYQISVGLSGDGVFGPLSRANFILEQSKMAMIPTLPSTAIVIPQSALSSFQIFIQSVKNLYATPMNGFVTSILLIAIIFMVFKIILL